MLLRLATALPAFILGASHLAQRSPIGASFCACGLLLLIGLLTPIAAALVAVSAIAIFYSWVEPVPLIFGPTVPALLVAVLGLAIALLGPGSISLDRRLFGRREIIIPASPGIPRKS